MKKKICFYHIYDKEGIIADYVLYWLSQLRDNNFEIVIVINGYINESSYSKLINYSKKIYIRENVGYDAMAYKEMLTVEYGQQKIMQYDECLLLNDTVFGPFIALSDIINKMDGRYDLWGISAQNPIESYYGENKDLPYHIQSYFLMFESDILKSNVFWDYWNDLVISGSYQETIENFEFKITKIALENDFKVGAYVDRNYEFGKKAVDLMERPMIMLSEYGIPILKKKLFTSKAFVEWDKFPINIYGYELIKYVKNMMICVILGNQLMIKK